LKEAFSPKLFLKLYIRGTKMNLFNELRQLKTLLIDDDEWIRDSLQQFFEAEGCHLTALETAEEAVAALKKQDFDIIITDFKLPGMDGLDFLGSIQESSARAIKILITAYGSEEVVAEAGRRGVQAFIEKPFTSDIVEGTLSSLIDRYNVRK